MKLPLWKKLGLSCPLCHDENGRYFESHRLYRIWRNMKRRTSQRPSFKSDRHYKYYDGITICKSWRKDFGRFYRWSMKHGYRDDLTIDRINPLDNYRPGNCRWLTYKEQRHNTRPYGSVSRHGKLVSITQTVFSFAK